MKVCGLSEIDVVEIGPGYGGLCFFMHEISIMFGITIKSYSMFDLRAPMLLQQKYLNTLGLKDINFVTLNNIKNVKKDSFLISNYAYSCIPLEIQKQYTNKLLNKYISYGFITWNTITTEIHDFIENKSLSIEDEYPYYGARNYYVKFRPSE